MEKRIARPFTFEQITWTGGQILRDELSKLKENNFALMRTLLQIGEPTKVLEKNDYAQNLPMDYDVDGISVSLLPHWGGYYIDGKWIPAPDPDVVPQEHVIQILKDDIVNKRMLRGLPLKSY